MNDWLRWTLMEFQDSISGLDLQSSSHSITLHDFIEERVFTSRETIEQLPNWRGIECGESCVTLRFTIRVESGESLQSVLITRRWSDVNKSNCFRESKEIWKFHSIEKRISFTSSIDFFVPFLGFAQFAISRDDEAISRWLVRRWIDVAPFYGTRQIIFSHIT